MTRRFFASDPRREAGRESATLGLVGSLLAILFLRMAGSSGSLLSSGTSCMSELKTRISTRFQLSTDAFAPYFDVVDSVFGTEIDYGQIHKRYAEEQTGEKRYSPPCVVSVSIKLLIGDPKYRHISTSFVERQNLTILMQMRRFTRLANAFSKKLENLKGALALHFFYYNFVRIHQSLRVKYRDKPRPRNTELEPSN